METIMKLIVLSVGGGAVFVFTAPTAEDELTHRGSWIGLWWKQLLIACVTLACMCATKC